MLIVLRRIIKFGWSGFIHNKEASAVTVFVITLAVLLMSGWLIFQGFSQALVVEVKNQMGISVYFHHDISEDQIIQVEKQLKQDFPQAIRDIRYVSSAQALEDFKKRHGGEALYQKALEEAGPEALRPSLDLTVYEESQYQKLTD